jgi:serine/threonine protein kinase
MDVWNANALIGAQLGSSTLERPLGIGGMGAVYLARQERPRRYVAVKVLRPGIATNDETWQIFLARFRREADAAAALDHANIVPIYEFGEQGSMAYIVMPYLADGSLANYLTADNRLSIEEVVSYIDQAAAALDYAHQHGIVHRDVKPSNLLLHPDGRLLLGDFGIARPLDAADLPAVATGFEGGDLTMAGAAMGTPEFMAPEQVRGDAVSAASDTYALGAVAYTLLAGRTPFSHPDISQVMSSQLSDSPPPLRSLRRDVSRDVEDAIAWAMAKDPSHRPGSTGSFARALHAASTGIPATTGSFNTTRSRPATLIAATPRNSMVGAPPPLGSRTDVGIAEFRDGPDSPTLFDGAYRGGRRGFGAPLWPSDTSSAANGSPMPAMQPRTIGLLALLGAAGVLVLTLAIVLASGSLQSLINLSGPNTSGDIIGHATATDAPTATPQPSPTAVVNWLRLSQSQVDLGCKGDKRSADVVLRNLGPHATDWHADKSNQFTFQISISPNSGLLEAGASKTITISYNPGFIALRNTIQFIANNEDAGQPAVLTYTAPSCLGRSSQGLSPTPQQHLKPSGKGGKHSHGDTTVLSGDLRKQGS